ncbi:MAG: alpha-D-glucose phosphate-specific phosphoglucomutase [Alphaproteobacteria bacterium]|nr:alpha-D-glucose phosphate-specific phosphoglucomutase [Alphaproteobacteria bacterium]MDY4689064.1 alpha-D-glucose phosphate-specific phosphoglucomutase [Alphaproteobacteria bacterium]
MLKVIKTTAYNDMKMGTAGLRKKSKVVLQENYLENFVQSVFNAIGGVEGLTFILGGDGRYYNKIAIQKIMKMAAANGMKKMIVGQNGFISTPASSHVLLMNKADGGFVLSASHNPGGINGDFGIKYAVASGGQCPTAISDKIYEISKTISEYKTLDEPDVDLSKLGTQKLGNMEIEVIDPVKDYVEMMENIFDFAAIKKLFANGFTMVFDAMNAVTGPYARKIFEEILGAKPGSVLNYVPLEDFGGLHPDPNLIYAKTLVDLMYSDKAPDFGAANDGDGDRNMILGKKFFVTPSDSLAILTDNYKLIPAYKNGIYGVAKSAATSTAVGRVAEALNIGYYEVPTGWKYFCNLMDSKRITFCGEESFGTGSSHIREKDGIWAVLFWLSIIAATGKSVHEITEEHWKKYGRSYYMRNDYEALDTEAANKLMADLESRLPDLAGKTFGAYTVSEAKPFIYNDPVDGSSTKNGLIVYFTDKSRIVYRLSGTGTNGATLRVYLERYETKDLNENVEQMLESLADVSRQIGEITERTGKAKADVLT